MLESTEDSNPTASLPYSLLISRILRDSQVDLFRFKATEVSATYDSHTFASMGYTLIDNQWHKKVSLKWKTDAPKSTRISADYVALITKEVDEIKGSLASLTTSVQDM